MIARTCGQALALAGLMLLAGVSSVAIGLAEGPVQGSSDCLPHPGIRIQGDTQLRLGPAVGVVNPAAAGTEEDPFVIEGWCILPTPLGSGIRIDETDAHILIRNNVIDGETTTVPTLGHPAQDEGVSLQDADNVTVRGNTITNHIRAAVEVNYGSDHVRILENTIRGNDFAGTDSVWLVSSADLTVADNRIADNTHGLELASVEDATIARNEIVANGAGAIVYSSSEVAFEANDIEANEAEGLRVSWTSELVDARDNWWGAPGGPSGDVEDACTDEVADGEGDEIGGSGDVCFDPWRSTPNPEAGPS